METPPGYAALFVDYENVYYSLKGQLRQQEDATDAIVQMIRALRERLKEDRGQECILQHAYGDFGRIGQNAQESLYLLGVAPHYVLGTDHKNAADMQLCIDALEALYLRPEVTTFLLVAGDRDYIPVIKHLKSRARTVLIVAFEKSMSGDLLQVVGEEALIKAESLLPPDALAPMEEQPAEKQPVRPAAVVAAPAPRPKAGAMAFLPWHKIESDLQRTALELMLRDFGNKPEVWVTPYLRVLREELPQLAEYERKTLISDLENCGAIRIEKRAGDPHDYSVILINWDHPDVRDLMP